ncbi:MAG: TfpX/TfpZ family type IV pilin accessory protein [Burkholderiales bacterium]
MTLTSLNRWKASALHLALSAAIAVAVVTLMLAVWYPQPYFAAMGGATLILLLIGVDVVVGPLITLIVFDPKKKSLRFDLAVIAALQIGALLYGCSVMFKVRPVYNVFVVDRFEVIAANAIEEESREKAALEFRSLPLTGPKVAAARQPDDPKRQSDIMISALDGGPDLANLPDLYVPYEQFRRDAGKSAKPLAELAKRQSEAAAAIRAFVAASGRAEDSMGFLPMKARNEDMAVVVDNKSGEIIGILPVHPW